MSPLFLPVFAGFLGLSSGKGEVRSRVKGKSGLRGLNYDPLDFCKLIPVLRMLNRAIFHQIWESYCLGIVFFGIYPLLKIV